MDLENRWERAEFPRPLIENLGKACIVGDGIEGYGSPDIDPLSAGLITMELSRGDGSRQHRRRGRGVGPRRRRRHMSDIEAVHTYEGTESMQTLIVGPDITGVSAFA
jgi:hypothetical protein